MSFQNDEDGDRRRKSVPQRKAEATNRAQKRTQRASPPEVGNALRSVYQRTVEEDIPPEMLDLLGKLG